MDDQLAFDKFSTISQTKNRRDMTLLLERVDLSKYSVNFVRLSSMDICVQNQGRHIPQVTVI